MDGVGDSSGFVVDLKMDIFQHDLYTMVHCFLMWTGINNESD